MAMINPTRMNLINLKKRTVIARKGHSILKRKREVLVIEFLKLLKESKESRSALNEIIKNSYRTVAIASSYVGNFELEEVAMQVEQGSGISIRVKNIMGVRIPEINKLVQTQASAQMLLGSSLAADDINESFSKALDSIVDVAQREQSLRRIAVEIDRTKRRVNALDYKVIPNMLSQTRYIRMRLEEIDRDTFSALKHVKKKIAKNSSGDAE
jgi:V/A-type H+-transporting ATPase subunit D